MTTTDSNIDHLLEADSKRPDVPLGPCPDWCTLPDGHGWDSIHTPELGSRGHQGPDYGKYISAGACEYDNAPGVQVYDINVSPDVEHEVITAAQARELAGDLIDAAAWIERHQS